MAIDAALGRLGIQQGVCTSSTRPTNPKEGQVIYETDTNRTLVYDNAAWLVVADNQVLSIDAANSRVGIGTASPARTLEVQSTSGAVTNFESTASNAYITLTDSGTTSNTHVRVGAVGDDMRFYAGDAERVRIDSSGNVGINDTTPSYTLDVNGDINTTGDLRIGGTAIGEWTSFTPSWDNVTVGDGTLTAEYCRVNEIVFWRLRLVFGSTTAFTGDIGVYYPVPADNNILGAAGGSVNCDDQTSTDYWGAIYRRDNNRAYVRVWRADLTYVGQTGVNATTPFTWTTGDTLVIEDWYRPA